MNRQSLIAKLPPEKGIEETIKKHQSLDDIIKEVLAAHDEFSVDYDRICKDFAGGSVEKNLYDFCRRTFIYDVETEEFQSTKSPTVLLKQGHCDCKGYAGFIAGVLDGLNRSGSGRYNWCYRFGEYPDELGEIHCHVFVVEKQQDGSEIWIDPVLDQFNKRDPGPDKFVDKTKPMLVRMSGVQNTPPPRPVPPLPRPIRHVAGPLTAYTANRIGFSPTPGYTPAQLGIPIAQQVFAKWNEYPGAVQALASNPPFRFTINGQQFPLPPQNTAGGTPVPVIPAGLTIQWDSNFMGMPIPADMLNVQVVGPALQIYPLEIYSAGGTGSATNAYLYNTHRYLLFLMLGVLENLIQCYSSYPWGNQYNDLSQQLNSARNYSNWLIYPWANKKTWVGSVISQAAQIYTSVQKVVTPIEASLLNTVIPGSGNILNAAGSLETNLINQVTGNNYSPAANYPTLIQQQPATNASFPGQLSMPSLIDTAVQFAQANPLPTIGILAAVGFALYEIFND